MPTQSLIESMEKLIVLHKQLNETAQTKTEALKNNDIGMLTKLLREEQKIAASIQIADKKREQSVLALANNQAATVSEIIDMVAGAEQEKLLDLQMKLSAELTELQQANELNQRLLQYSLQFINLNLDLLAPDRELPNYTKTQSEMNEHSIPSRSIFDSKA